MRRVPVAILTLLILCTGAAAAEPAPSEMTTKAGDVILVREALRGTAPTIDKIMEGYPAPMSFGAPDRAIENPSISEPLLSEGREPDVANRTAARGFLATRTPTANLSILGYDSDDNVALGQGALFPPDTEGDVGVDYYVQYNNVGWRYFNKSNGSLAGGPFPGNSFWQGSTLPPTSPCVTNNAGDPIVLFDHIAGEWVFSQFVSSSNPVGHQCFAITQGGNPAGPYVVYDFQVGPNAPNAEFNDYEKIGVWTTANGSQSAYHMTSNQFNLPALNAFLGVRVTAFERDAMLTGAAATSIEFFKDLNTDPSAAGHVPYSFQPAHLEGPAPPAGTCNYYAQLNDGFFTGQTGTEPDGYQFWEFCVNFGRPASSTFTEGPFVPAQSSFLVPNVDVPQPGTSIRLDVLSGRAMYRFTTRMIGGTLRGVFGYDEQLTGSQHTVSYASFSLPSLAGITLDDEGTLQPPDGQSRWMPAAGFDSAGNIGIVYSRSGSGGGQFPSVYFTGRETGDPPGSLQTEAVCVNGSGIQTGTQNGRGRWGDYATVSMDPVDNCTFWVTNEYVETTGSVDWDTRICSYTFPSCGAPVCTQDSDCDNGDFCDGAETCDIPSGICQPGTAPDCDDGVSCTVDSCNETTDSCDNVANDGLCDNGAFCDGAELCDAVNDCQAGTAVDCTDGVSCTVDSCNEGTDSCDNVPDNALCDNGQFCDGAETCDAVNDCQPGTDPCAPLACDEVGDVCIGGPTAQLESDCLTVGGSNTTVNLTNTYVSAVITTSVQYSNNTTPVVPRISSVTSNSFDVRLENPSSGPVAADNLCYLVVEEGTWTIDGVDVEAQKYTSTVTDDAPSNWVGEAQSYGQPYSSPAVLGSVMSSNDADFTVFWDMATTRANPPTAAALATGKTVCEDTDVTRADETVGFVVIESGHGTIAGVEYEAALGADTVAGVADAPPYTYSFNTPFAVAPAVAVVTMAAVDGNNGGWAQVHGSTMATTTSLFLSIDEDQIGDTERNHTSEQVAYVAFAGSVVYPDAGCTSDLQCDNGLYCDGAETCDIPSGICQPGTAPDCDDGVSCTVDSCNEGTDSCDNVANDGLCDNGQFCDGAELCDAVNDCQAGTAVDCTDGVSCTVDSCNETTDTCDNVPNDAACEDGSFCTGVETCDPVLDCQSSGDPCQPGETCNEATDTCDPGATTVMEWGTVNAGSSAVTVNLTGTYTSPVIVTSINYDNNTIPVVTRISSVTATSFAVNLQNAGAGSVATDEVSWLVVEEGVHTVSGVQIQAATTNSTVTDENNSWVGQAQSLTGGFSSPVVVGQVMSSNDPDWSVFWDQGATRQSPPSASTLRTGKTVCEDTLTARAAETVGWIAIEAGHGTLGGVEFEAALGADTVRGVTQAPPYTYTYQVPFATAPAVAVVTMAAVDGGNGGWAYTFGPSPTSTTSLDLVIDEDTIGDSERNHTTEQVGYVVFAGPGSAQ